MKSWSHMNMNACLAIQSMCICVCVRSIRVGLRWSRCFRFMSNDIRINKHGQTLDCVCFSLAPSNVKTIHVYVFHSLRRWQFHIFCLWSPAPMTTQLCHSLSLSLSVTQYVSLSLSVGNTSVPFLRLTYEHLQPPPSRLILLRLFFASHGWESDILLLYFLLMNEKFPFVWTAINAAVVVGVVDCFSLPLPLLPRFSHTFAIDFNYI